MNEGEERSVAWLFEIASALFHTVERPCELASVPAHTVECSRALPQAVKESVKWILPGGAGACRFAEEALQMCGAARATIDR